MRPGHRFTLVAGSAIASVSLLADMAGYEDNVVSWPSVEPADDYTANSTLAFALAAAS